MEEGGRWGGMRGRGGGGGSVGEGGGGTGRAEGLRLEAAIVAVAKLEEVVGTMPAVDSHELRAALKAMAAATAAS